MIPPEVIAEVLKLACRNRDKAANALPVAWNISDLKSQKTVKRILVDNGISRDPETKKHIDWELFISSHKDVLTATDFFTAEVEKGNLLKKLHSPNTTSERLLKNFIL